MNSVSIYDCSANVQKHFSNYDVLEKGRKENAGEVCACCGRKYQKTADGWQLLKEEKDAKSGQSEKTDDTERSQN
jgi:CO dehydrogenase nickel-insertion accessory protein CooC1